MKRFSILLAFAVILSLVVVPATAPEPTRAVGEVLNLSIDRGSVGTVVTVTGSGFDPGTPPTYSANIIFAVYSGGTVFNYTTGIYSKVAVQPINADGTFTATFSVPEMLGDGATFQTVSQGTYYVIATYHIPPATDESTILNAKAFAVLGGRITITPDSGPAGTEVTLSGSDFGASEDILVKYDEEGLSIFQGARSTNGSGEFAGTKIFIPASTAGEHFITVSGMTSSHQAGASFTVEPTLVIKPSPGAASSTITVSGIGFGAGANYNVTFNGVIRGSGITESNGSFVFSLPPNTLQDATYTVSASDDAGNTDQLNYEVYDAVVTLEPTTGSPGWDVTISGTGFKPDKNITISFEGFGSGNNVTARSDDNGEFTSVCTVPWGTIGTWDIEVTDGDTTKTKGFEVDTSSNIYPITSISVPGYVGTEITIAGSNFIAGRTVTVTYSGTQLTTGTVENDGSFSITFPAPSSSSGIHRIEATDGTNTIPYAYVIENSPPAKPLTLLPETGTKAKSEAYFDWEDVADPSGVTYTLQIATDPSFSESYMILEQKGIQVSEYTVPAQNRLNTVTKEAPYYWRVRAVDKALNEGEWTDTATFHVGFAMSLPQSVIYIIIVGAALLLAVFTFWLGRKTAYY